MAEKQSFEVEITFPAKQRYQEEVLEYLLENFSFERTLEIDKEITSTTNLLSKMPERGGLEPSLEHHKESFRFILHKETRNFEIKIIYYVNSSINKVYVTDFFPVLMQPEQLKRRS
jgi:plasmid stabilization system protein ParE